MRDRNRKCGERGNGAIEFALGFTLLWACFSGAFQYGYSMYVYNSLQTAVNSGASYAARATYCAGNSDFNDQVKRLVVYGDPSAASGTPTVPNLAVSNVTVTLTPAAFPDTVTVRVVNYTANALFTSFTFSNKPAVTVSYLGNYQPTC
jgi:Flp pilus assembly protein TadG